MDVKKKSYLTAWVVMVMMWIGNSYGVVQAQEVGRWEKLGSRTVNLSVEKDVIQCAHKGSFTAIRFHVEKAPVSFLGAAVKYANGNIDNLDFKQTILAGGTSRYLDLRGQKRIIKEVILYYKSEPKRHGQKHKKAKVEVWGRH